MPSAKPISPGDVHDELGEVIHSSTERVLSLARSWLRWDGRQLVSDGGDRIYTPNKAIRRYADHLIDHTAEIAAILADLPSEPDYWRGSLTTTEGDWCHFTEVELNEAEQRLRRLALTLEVLVRVGGRESWDVPRTGGLTIRQIVEHVSSSWYAEQIGDLNATAAPPGATPQSE